MQSAAAFETEASKIQDINSVSQFYDSLKHNTTEPLSTLMLQIITIILVARIIGYVFKKIGQPSVIGEIVAGIVLGPTILGRYAPEAFAALFPVTSLANLKFLSQIGLILFMFVIGMEIDFKVLRTKANEALVISHASIIIPFSLGVSFAYFIYKQYSPDHVNFISFALFIGISMSVTAFPVLARIVQERQISKTKLGTIALTCAAIDDITAWCGLAAVIAIVKAGSFVSSLYTLLAALLYVLFMLKIVQPFLRQLGEKYSSKEGLTKPVVAVFFFTLITSAYLSEMIGIHALFGAFMAGVIMPENINFRNVFIEKVEDVSHVLLLPLFFVYTGLRTQIGLLDEANLWYDCAMIIGIGVTGKFIGSAFAARYVGQTWKESLTIGALMNTRGLMELIVLNIGFDLGVIDQRIFAMMVIMALFTTFMTGPSLDIIEFIFKDKTKITEKINEDIASEKYSVLISYGNPAKGKQMLRLAYWLTKNIQSKISTIHISPSGELNKYNLVEYEKDSINPVRREAQKLSVDLTTHFKPALDIDKEIVDFRNSAKYDLLLIGLGNSVFKGSLLGNILGLTSKILNPKTVLQTIKERKIILDDTLFDEHTNFIIKNSVMPVGIFIDKKFNEAKNIIIPVYTIGDSFLSIYIQKFFSTVSHSITIYDATQLFVQYPELKHNFTNQLQNAKIISKANDEIKLFKSFDLCILNIDSWKECVKQKEEWLTVSPSILILKS